MTKIQYLINALHFKQLAYLGQKAIHLSEPLSCVGKHAMVDICSENELRMINWETTRCITIFANWVVAPLPGHTYDYGTLSEIAKSQLLQRGRIIEIYVELKSSTKKLDPKVLLSVENEQIDYSKINMTNNLKEAISQFENKEKEPDGLEQYLEGPVELDASGNPVSLLEIENKLEKSKSVKKKFIPWPWHWRQ